MMSFSRRAIVQAAGLAALAAPAGRVRAADVPTIRYATGGGIGPNEMETIVFLDGMKQNVLKAYGKAYTLDMTFTRGTPEAASLLAGGQADLATLSFPTFATLLAKDAVPGGLTIIADNYQDGHAGYATNMFVVRDDAPIHSVSDLKGRRIAINAFASAVDLDLRVVLKRNGLDPRRDVQIVELGFASIGPAVREKRVDCGVLVIPFLPPELEKGGLRSLFTGADAFGPSSLIFQVATNRFLHEHPDAVRGYCADYVAGLKWLTDPTNRETAIAMISDLTKSPKSTLDSYFATARDYFRDPNGCVAASSIQKPIDAMVDEKLLVTRIDVAKYLDMSYLPHPCTT